MNHADVTALQKVLVSAGFLSATPSGYFGTMTKAAVKAYQKAHGLDQVGNVGPKTRASLNSCGSSAMGSDKESLIAALKAQLKILLDKIAALMAAAGSTSGSSTSTSTPSSMTGTTTPSMTGTSTPATTSTSTPVTTSTSTASTSTQQ
jgi:peptidoglycan hydrolase-like protein with peptidoglycan-binding domain